MITLFEALLYSVVVPRPEVLHKIKLLEAIASAENQIIRGHSSCLKLAENQLYQEFFYPTEENQTIFDHFHQV
jgi:hypothetical protein